MKTNQEIFDECVLHVLTQGRQAVDSTLTSCVYLSRSGLSCALGGPIVKAGLYDPKMEGDSVRMLIQGSRINGALKQALDAWGVDKTQYAFLSQIQFAHDNWDWELKTSNFLTYFLIQIKKVGEEHNLSFETVSQHPNWR